MGEGRKDQQQRTTVKLIDLDRRLNLSFHLDKKILWFLLLLFWVKVICFFCLFVWFTLKQEKRHLAASIYKTLYQTKKNYFVACDVARHLVLCCQCKNKRRQQQQWKKTGKEGSKKPQPTNMNIGICPKGMVNIDQNRYYVYIINVRMSSMNNRRWTLTINKLNWNLLYGRSKWFPLLLPCDVGLLVVFGRPINDVNGSVVDDTKIVSMLMNVRWRYNMIHRCTIEECDRQTRILVVINIVNDVRGRWWCWGNT